MLLSYKIENFKSFKNMTEFSLRKTNYKMLTDTNTLGKAVKGLMYVGANASGKSNSLIALKFLLDCLFGRNDIDFGKYKCLFSSEPVMSLNYIFDIDGTEICYNIAYEFTQKKCDELLLVNSEEILKREGASAYAKINDLKTYADIPANILFLRDIYFNTKFRGNEILQKWFDFLSNSIYIDMYKRNAILYRDITLDIKDYLENNGADTINNFFKEYGFKQRIEYSKSSHGDIIHAEADEKRIWFKRENIAEPIPMEWESLGNRLMLTLLPSFFHCIKEGGLLLIDEFSSGFHNELEELLIRYFMRNAQDSQVIFVSHSTNLLSNSILRPDQIYSVDFDADGSKINRFSNEKPREAQNLEKMYLSGIFNGVPNYEYRPK